jgi:uncharacterized membrane protein
MMARSVQAVRERQTQVRASHHFDMEVLVGYILLVGVLLSIALILAGLIWHVISTHQIGFEFEIAGTNLYRFALANLNQLTAHNVSPQLLISLGIIVLLLTPYVRVLASMIYFAVAAHNWKYTLFTAFVLSVLTYGLFLR